LSPHDDFLRVYWARPLKIEKLILARDPPTIEALHFRRKMLRRMRWDGPECESRSGPQTGVSKGHPWV